MASANITTANDSAYVFRYNADLELICSGTIAESDPVYRYNDAPLVCTGGATAESPMDGTATHSETELVQTPFIFFDGSCNAIHSEPHPTFPPVAGASILWDEDGGYFWEVRSASDDFTLLFQLYSSWMVPVEKSHTRDGLVPEDYTTRWPQSALRIGDYYFIAHLARAPGITYNADKGDVWIQVFDRNLTHLQSVQITELGDGDGAQRPWLSHRDGQLVLVYDQALWPRLVPITLSAAVTGSEDGGGDGEDGGGDDGSGGDDGGDSALDSGSALLPDSGQPAGGPKLDGGAAATCGGCATPANRGAAAGWLLFGATLLGVGRRRR